MKKVNLTAKEKDRLEGTENEHRASEMSLDSSKCEMMMTRSRIMEVVAET